MIHTKEQCVVCLLLIRYKNIQFGWRTQQIYVKTVCCAVCLCECEMLRRHTESLGMVHGCRCFDLSLVTLACRAPYICTKLIGLFIGLCFIFASIHLVSVLVGWLRVLVAATSYVKSRLMSSSSSTAASSVLSIWCVVHIPFCHIGLLSH